jgi:hypothetical protein
LRCPPCQYPADESTNRGNGCRYPGLLPLPDGQMSDRGWGLVQLQRSAATLTQCGCLFVLATTIIALAHKGSRLNSPGHRPRDEGIRLETGTQSRGSVQSGGWAGDQGARPYPIIARAILSTSIAAGIGVNAKPIAHLGHVLPRSRFKLKRTSGKTINGVATATKKSNKIQPMNRI